MPGRAASDADRGYVKKINTSGPAEGPDDDGYVTAKAEHMTFDILVPNAGGGHSVVEKVGFSNPVPSEYKIKVRLGERVWISRSAGLMEFCVPWLPKTKPCPGQGAARGGGGSPFLPLPAGSVAPPTGTGGGNTAPPGTGQGGQPSGDGSVVQR